MGQINMTFDELQETNGSKSEQFKELDICAANMLLGKAHVKVSFRRR